MKRLSFAFAFLITTACQTVQEPELNVTSSPILQGDPVEIRLTNLEPGSSVTLTLEETKLRRGVPAFYTSTAMFT
ncbi:MAG: hypothetical protein AAGH90_10095, partial [Pseudomonadota bacterium]